MIVWKCALMMCLRCAITDKQFSDLKFVAKIKTLVHGRDKAYVVNPMYATVVAYA